MTPEQQLLLLCCRADSAESPETLETLLRIGIDWPTVLRQGGRHGALPSVWRRVREYGTRVPSPVRDALERRYWAVAARNLQIATRLTDLVTALEGASVAAIVLKGPALAATVYPDPAAREIGDLDLLIRKADLDLAGHVLASAGLERAWLRSPAQEAILQRTWYAYTFHDSAAGLPLELHWRLVPRFFPLSLSEDVLLKETEEVSFEGRQIRIFRPEMQLLTLCIHGAKTEPEPWSKLKWIQDVAVLIQATRDMHWERLLQLAETAGCVRLLLLGLELASRVLGSPLPADLLHRAAADAVAGRLADEIAGQLFGESATLTPLGRLRFELAMRERFVDRTRTVLGRAFLPGARDLAVVELPAGLAGLYYPLRLLRLGGTAVCLPWNLRRLRKPLERGRPHA